VISQHMRDRRNHVCWAGEMRRGPCKEGPPQPTGPDCSGRSATSARPGGQLWPVVHMDCRNALLQACSCVIAPQERRCLQRNLPRARQGVYGGPGARRTPWAAASQRQRAHAPDAHRPCTDAARGTQRLSHTPPLSRDPCTHITKQFWLITCVHLFLRRMTRPLSVFLFISLTAG